MDWFASRCMTERGAQIEVFYLPSYTLGALSHFLRCTPDQEPQQKVTPFCSCRGS